MAAQLPAAACAAPGGASTWPTGEALNASAAYWEREALLAAVRAAPAVNPPSRESSPWVFDMAADEGAADPWYGMTAGEEAAFLARGSADAAADAGAKDGGLDNGEEAHVGCTQRPFPQAASEAAVMEFGVARGEHGRPGTGTWREGGKEGGPGESGSTWSDQSLLVERSFQPFSERFTWQSCSGGRGGEKGGWFPV